MPNATTVKRVGNMKLLTSIVLLIVVSSGYAEGAWETHIEGRGTPFEARWASVDPLSDDSSPETSLGWAGINAEDGILDLYVVHPLSVSDSLIAALGGKELECSFGGWRLAVGRREFRIRETSESTDGTATFLKPEDYKAFWEAFAAGSVLAVQVERVCDGDADMLTMVYTLAGSRSAMDYVLNKAPPVSQQRERPDKALPESNGEGASEEQQIERADMSSSEDVAATRPIQEKIERNWVRPPGTDGLKCTVSVRLGANGSVLLVSVVESSGHIAFDRSVEAAVRRADPLPVPTSEPLKSRFRRGLTLVFDPDG